MDLCHFAPKYVDSCTGPCGCRPLAQSTANSGKVSFRRIRTSRRPTTPRIHLPPHYLQTPHVRRLNFLSAISPSPRFPPFAKRSQLWIPCSDLSAMASSETVTVNVEFSGGTELLLPPPHTKRHRLQLPRANAQGRSTDVADLIQHIRRNLIVEREELFVDGDSVRPGILVLINNGDWELEGEGEYILQDNDEVVFISTLHGG
ncbi:Ubiquitin-related modifier 1 [Thecaphora frezii]